MLFKSRLVFPYHDYDSCETFKSPCKRSTRELLLDSQRTPSDEIGRGLALAEIQNLGAGIY